MSNHHSRRRVAKYFTIGGLVLGLLCGLIVVVPAYIAVPSSPGMFELLFQILLIGILAVVGAALGFGFGFLVSVFQREE